MGLTCPLRCAVSALIFPLAACSSIVPVRDGFRSSEPAAWSAPSPVAARQETEPQGGSAVTTTGQDASGAEVVLEEPFILPFFGDAARERGYELPRPLGVGVNFMFINRPTRVNGVKAGVNGNGLTELDSISVDAQASVRTAITRVDAWILPMLNVYLLGGYIWNTSAVDLVVDLPGAPGTRIESSGELEGPTYGVGATAAAGYKEFFASLDFNVSRSELGDLSTFTAKLTTLRLGWNGKLNDMPLRAYTGASYWDTKRTIEGSITTGGGGPVQSIQFAVDQEPVDPVTVLLGASLTITEQFWIMLEVQGWNETQALLGGVSVRF